MLICIVSIKSVTVVVVVVVVVVFFLRYVYPLYLYRIILQNTQISVLLWWSNKWSETNGRLGCWTFLLHTRNFHAEKRRPETSGQILNASPAAEKTRYGSNCIWLPDGFCSQFSHIHWYVSIRICSTVILWAKMFCFLAKRLKEESEHIPEDKIDCRKPWLTSSKWLKRFDCSCSCCCCCWNGKLNISGLTGWNVNEAIENWTNGETEFIEFSLLSLLLEFSVHLNEYFRTDT